MIRSEYTHLLNSLSFFSLAVSLSMIILLLTTILVHGSTTAQSTDVNAEADTEMHNCSVMYIHINVCTANTHKIVLAER